jgi:acyl-CoA hydrolase
VRWPIIWNCSAYVVDGMVFHTPLHACDEVTVYANLISTELRSIKFQVEI